jgi:segregation and condensation protein B
MAVGMESPSEGIHEESFVAMAKKKKSEITTIQANENERAEAPAAEETSAPEASLETAAAEWSADPITTGHDALTESSDESSSEDAKKEPAPVTFVSDPFSLGSTYDVSAAQRSDEELDLDADFEHEEDASEESEEEDEELQLETDEAAMSETLQRLQERMASEEAEVAKVLAAAGVLSEEEAEKHLAEQIAEDVALEKEMKAEADANEEEEAAEVDPELLAALPREPEEDEHGNLDLSEMESCIEALLFMSEKPMGVKKLRELLGPEMALEYFEEALVNLQKRYARLSHGIELVEIAHGYQFRTKAVRAPLAKKLAKISTQRLSTGAMESLAIIAYKQPVMKDDIDKIRGVDSSHFIRGLLDKKLIKIDGRSDLPGRPMLYSTSTEFLEVFSLASLDALPPLKELESMIPGSQSGSEDDVDPRVKKMRALVSEMNADDSVSLLYNARDDDEFLSEIREKVKSIEITTPTLKAQNDEAEAAKQAEKARKKAIEDGTLDPQAESFADAVGNAAPGETAEMPIEPS